MKTLEYESSTRTLAGCAAGDRVQVVDIASDAVLAQRLGEVGVFPGVCLRVIRGGAPVIVQVDESRFCLRGEEAAQVAVQLPHSSYADQEEPSVVVGGSRKPLLVRMP